MTEKQRLHELRIKIRASLKIISQNLELVDEDSLEIISVQIVDLQQKVILSLQKLGS